MTERNGKLRIVPGSAARLVRLDAAGRPIPGTEVPIIVGGTVSDDPLDFGKLLRRSKVGRTFTAAFPGECALCLDDIEPGDDVLYYYDELIHEDCNPELVPDD